MMDCSSRGPGGVGDRRSGVPVGGKLGGHRRRRAAQPAGVGHDDDGCGLRCGRCDGRRGRRGGGGRGCRVRRRRGRGRCGRDGGRGRVADRSIGSSRLVGDRPEDGEPGDDRDRGCREHDDGRDRCTAVSELGRTTTAGVLAVARRCWFGHPATPFTGLVLDGIVGRRFIVRPISPQPARRRREDGEEARPSTGHCPTDEFTTGGPSK